MTTRGYFSAVEDRDDNTRLLIRARCETDIRSLNDLLPGEPYANGGTDYPWRLSCTRDEWTTALITLGSEIRYQNFKDSVRSKKHKSAYTQVWRTLLSLEDGTNLIGRSTTTTKIQTKAFQVMGFPIYSVDEGPATPRTTDLTHEPKGTLVGQKVIAIDGHPPAKATRTPPKIGEARRVKPPRRPRAARPR